jgi:hypothetical protein
MQKKALNLTQITTLSFTVVLILSCFAGAVNLANGQTANFSTQPTGSASVIATLENTTAANGGWNSSLQTIYDGIALSQTTVSQLQKAVDAININSTSAAETVFYWYFVLEKFGVTINATIIETALNEVTMLPNGLPDDSTDGNGVAAFSVYNRYDVCAYEWAAQLHYETSKWNITEAYNAFKTSVNQAGEPVLWVNKNGVGSGISYGPRYYDEGAQTIDMFLEFYLAGIPDGIDQAVNWWNWVNSKLWDTTDYSGGSFYKYALDWPAFECEAGGFDQIIWKLYYYDTSISNVGNLFTDMETRWLNQNWSSPGWLNYVTVHATGVDGYSGNSQERLPNTIMSWASLLGFYGNMTSTMQSQVQGLLDGVAGPAPAWSLLFQSELYDNSTGMFSMFSGTSGSVQATADATVLIMLLSTVPVNGSLAVPIEDSVYQDIDNIIDGEISNVNLTSRTVTVSVAEPGTFRSMFGTNIFEYDLNSSGVWQLTFASDWNSITNETLVSPLPTSRIYLGTNPENSTTIYASSDSYSTITPSGSVNVTYGGNQTFTYSADGGYVINQVLVDGSPVTITGSYTFTDVKAPHTISVLSSPVLSPTPSPSPSPTPSPSPSPTPSPSPSPTPTPSPTPSPTPTASPTPSPSASPRPSPTSSPTPSPTSSSTPNFPLISIPSPALLGALISLAVLLTVSILLLSYIKKRKSAPDTGGTQ